MLGHDRKGLNGDDSIYTARLYACAKEKAADEEISLGKPAINLSKGGNQSKHKIQGRHSPGAATAGSNPLQPTKQRKLLHHISMDEDIYEYIQTYYVGNLKI